MRPSTTSPRSRDVTLLEAMRAAERPRPHRLELYAMASPISSRSASHGWRTRASDGTEPSWAVTRVYLGFLAHLPDTLIERKFGTRTAALVREEAGPIEASFTECPAPEA